MTLDNISELTAEQKILRLMVSIETVRTQNELTNQILELIARHIGLELHDDIKETHHVVENGKSIQYKVKKVNGKLLRVRINKQLPNEVESTSHLSDHKLANHEIAKLIKALLNANSSAI